MFEVARPKLLARALLMLAAAFALVLVPVATKAPAARADWGDLRAMWSSWRGDAYSLDAIDRHLGSATQLACAPPEDLVSYRGTVVRYDRSVRVHRAFRERLERFDRVVDELARETYGRAPRRVRTAGAYSCRAVRGNNGRLSEHALGNAIDIASFEFRALPRRVARSSELPRELKRRFSVGVLRHWSATDPIGAIHAQFLHRLVERLGEENVFRGIIGPADPRHRGHLHFDAGPFPYRYY